MEAETETVAEEDEDETEGAGAGAEAACGAADTWDIEALTGTVYVPSRS